LNSALDGAPCPFGCLGSNGVAAAFDWSHVAYYCAHRSFVRMRQECVTCAEQTLATINDRVAGSSGIGGMATRTFDQVLRFVRLAKPSCGEGWVTVVARTRWVLSAMPRSGLDTVEEIDRELVGGLVRNTGSSKHDRDRLVLGRR
jgi:hypothetical protein